MHQIKSETKPRGNSFVIISPNNEVIYGRNLHKFCRERGLNSSALCKVIKGQYMSHMGYIAIPKEIDIKNYNELENYSQNFRKELKIGINKLTSEEIVLIAQKYANGYAMKKLAADFHVGLKVIREIIKTNNVTKEINDDYYSGMMKRIEQNNTQIQQYNNPWDCLNIPEERWFNPHDLKGEMWKEISEFSEYQVSSFGRVKTLKNQYAEKILTPIFAKKGYFRYHLVNQVRDMRCAGHRLVALAFVLNTNPLEFNQINHKNGIKSDNRIENLEWTNNSGNQKHAFAIGLNKANKGEACGTSKLKDYQVIEIREKYSKGQYSLLKLAREYNVSKRTILGIIHRKTWQHI